MTHAWVDASAGVAGDMLLGALLDAGADLAVVQRAVDAVVPGSVLLTTSVVTRAGLRATKADVQVLVTDPPHRRWRTIADLLAGADLPQRVRRDATAVFARLAAAEARAHGIDEADVLEEVLLAPHAVKRLIEPDEVAETIAFLLGPGGRAFTGVPVTMDLGWTAR